MDIFMISTIITVPVCTGKLNGNGVYIRKLNGNGLDQCKHDVSTGGHASSKPWLCMSRKTYNSDVSTSSESCDVLRILYPATLLQ